MVSTPISPMIFLFQNDSGAVAIWTVTSAWGVKHGLLDAAEYRPAIENGWAALARSVAKGRRLGWGQQVSDRPDARAETDTQVYGVGAVLLAATAAATLTEGWHMSK